MTLPRFPPVWRWLFRSHRQAAGEAAHAVDARRDIQRKQVVMLQLQDMLRHNGRQGGPGPGRRPR